MEIDSTLNMNSHFEKSFKRAIEGRIVHPHKEVLSLQTFKDR